MTSPMRPKLSDEEIRRLIEANDQRDRERRVAERLKNSGLPEGLYHAELTPPPDGQMRLDEQHAYTASLSRLGIVQVQPAIMALIGGTGRGKTYMAAALVVAYCRADKPARLVTADEIVGNIRATYGFKTSPGSTKAVTDRYCNVALLVIDEWGSRSPNRHDDETLTNIIIQRHAKHLPTLIISNETTANAFTRSIDVRVASRMKERSGGVVVCTWDDLRGRIEPDAVAW